MRGIAALCLLAPMASCVPAAMESHLAAPNELTIALPDEPLPAPPPAAELTAQTLLPPAEALTENQAIPMSLGPNPAARPFIAAAASIGDGLRAEDCLAEAIYYEARSQSDEGQRAVAQVVLNRVRHPAYPSSVCGVVFEGVENAGIRCQFTFACDGSMQRPPAGPAWDRARRIAAMALAGSVYAPVGDATHYHSFAVLPAWAGRMDKLAVVGAHIFYRLGGGWGAPAAFVQRYSGREPDREGLARQMSFRRAFAPVTQTRSAYAAYAPRGDTSWLPVAGDRTAEARPADDGLPESTIRPEFRNTGRIIGASN